MTELAKKTPSGANAPYKIKRVDGEWAVVNNTGDVKAKFGQDRDKALRYLRALYANVPGAPKRAGKVKFSGKAKDRVAAADVAQPHPFIKKATPRPPLRPDDKARTSTTDNSDCTVCGMDKDNPIHKGPNGGPMSTGMIDEQALLEHFDFDIPVEVAGFPKNQKCKYCAEKATKRVIHSEGMAYVPACDNHLDDAKDAAARCTPDGSNDPSNIDYIRDVPEAAAEDNSSGVMICFYPPDDMADDLALDNEEAEDPSELHVTLAYLGKLADLSSEDQDRLRKLVEGFAHSAAPVDAQLSGYGVFAPPSSPGAEDVSPVTYLSVDAPALPAFRQRLVEALQAGGFPVAMNHGYTPHMTLAYGDMSSMVDMDQLGGVEFDEISLVLGNVRIDYPLTADDDDEDTPETAATDDDGTVYLNVDGEKKYPIKTAKDAVDAWKLRNHGKGVSEAQVLAHIRRACSKLGIALPPQMRGGSDSEKSFSVEDISMPTLDEMRRMVGYAVEAAAEVKKTKKGKHRFVGKQHVTASAYHGAGWAGNICGACGRDQNDPDHDGDMDSMMGPDVDAPTTAAADDDVDAGKMAQGLDAAIDQALVLLRSTPDLPPYAAQARDLLQGVEETCDALLDYFGVSDSDEPDGPDAADSETSTLQRLLQEQATSVAASAALLAENAKRFSVLNIKELTKPREVAEKVDPVPLDTIKAFLTEVDGKTILTAPASTRDLGMWETALTPNEHVLWIQGRFVGADEPNRNGAFWSSHDLESGASTVPFGPLNWLHDAKKIIGCIADQRMVYPDEQAAASGLRPHIAAVSAMYRWIYPEEAAVIEMAGERGSLWYSMECVSKEVACVGDTGCGSQVSYMDYLKGFGCDHMTKRTGVRQLVDPTFLGGAVIVPPARPGWADADVSIMRQAASFAEQAVAQMGTSDLPGFEVERLLAEVLRFATA